MIKSDNTGVTIDGIGFDIIKEFANIARAIGHEEKLIPKKMMYQIVDAAYMTEEELREHNKKDIEEIKNTLDRISELMDLMSSLDESDVDGSHQDNDKNDISEIKDVNDIFDDIFKDFKGGN